MVLVINLFQFQNAKIHLFSVRIFCQGNIETCNKDQTYTLFSLFSMKYQIIAFKSKVSENVDASKFKQEVQHLFINE